MGLTSCVWCFGVKVVSTVRQGQGTFGLYRHTEEIHTTSWTNTTISTYLEEDKRGHGSSTLSWNSMMKVYFTQKRSKQAGLISTTKPTTNVPLFGFAFSLKQPKLSYGLLTLVRFTHWISFHQLIFIGFILADLVCVLKNCHWWHEFAESQSVYSTWKRKERKKKFFFFFLLKRYKILIDVECPYL